MNPRRFFPWLTVAVAALAACAQRGGPDAAVASSGETDAVVLVAPSANELQTGCWATFFDQRNFEGDSLTLVGPIELQSLDKGSARQLKRAIDSIVTGPRASLTVYDHQLFSNRSVGFMPGSRETSLVDRLGFAGRIESLRLECDG
jgi:hypothetical protein